MPELKMAPQCNSDHVAGQTGEERSNVVANDEDRETVAAVNGKLVSAWSLDGERVCDIGPVA